MCGIWTSLGLTPDKSVIRIVAHRGPDGEGWRRMDTPHGPLIMAHRRLAVIDTSDSGSQPMSYGDGRFWVVFNGMIYNYIELRAELQKMGHIFKNFTDTEVLLAAYAEWGERALDRFNGMFAFVIWDKKKQIIFAARDRYGVKPLFWTRCDNGIAFASEIKQFTALEKFSANLDYERAYDFLTFGVTDHHSETIFAGVNQIRGGECISIKLTQGSFDDSFAVKRWYHKPVPDTQVCSGEEAIQKLYGLLKDSVHVRLRSDVEFGFGLSGGIDSSSIVSLAQIPGDRKRMTVSACYEDKSVDERFFINLVNKHANTKPIYVFPDGKELVRDLDQLVWHMDGPFTSTSMFAQWSVFKAAKKQGIKVMLGGQGADEQLCGYHSAFAPFYADLLRSGYWLQLFKETSAERRRHGTSLLWQVSALGASVLPQQLREIVRRVRKTHRPFWLNGEVIQNFKSPLTETHCLNDFINSQIFEAGLPMLLRYEDRNSMAHGIESRLPFMDHRVVELNVGLGSKDKIVDGETKWLLRRAMDKVLPKEITNRQDKIGFSTPEYAWLSGPAKVLVEQGIREAIERFPNLFDAKELNNLKDGVLGGYVPFDFTLWRIICLSIWGRVFEIRA